MAFKLKLLTSRVAIDQSFVAGDEYDCGNDEAWFMIEDGLAELVSKKKPAKPERVIAAEKAKQEAEESQDK